MKCTVYQVTLQGYCSDTTIISFSSLVASRDTTCVAGEWLKVGHILTSAIHTTGELNNHNTVTLLTHTPYGIVCDSPIGVLRAGPSQLN